MDSIECTSYDAQSGPGYDAWHVPADSMSEAFALGECRCDPVMFVGSA
jgi:hypothetical protein